MSLTCRAFRKSLASSRFMAQLCEQLGMLGLFNLKQVGLWDEVSVLDSTHVYFAEASFSMISSSEATMRQVARLSKRFPG